MSSNHAFNDGMQYRKKELSKKIRSLKMYPNRKHSSQDMKEVITLFTLEKELLRAAPSHATPFRAKNLERRLRSLYSPLLKAIPHIWRS